MEREEDIILIGLLHYHDLHTAAATLGIITLPLNVASAPVHTASSGHLIVHAGF